MDKHVIARAILHHFEEYPVHYLDFPSIIANNNGSRSCEEAVINTIKNARRTAPSVLYWPHIYIWWNTASLTLRNTILMALHSLPATCPILLLITGESQNKIEGDIYPKQYITLTTDFQDHLSSPPNEALFDQLAYFIAKTIFNNIQYKLYPINIHIYLFHNILNHQLWIILMILLIN